MLKYSAINYETKTIRGSDYIQWSSRKRVAGGCVAIKMYRAVFATGEQPSL